MEHEKTMADEERQEGMKKMLSLSLSLSLSLYFEGGRE